MVNEVLDDLAHYPHWQLYVFHFGLWRLQGIIEGFPKLQFSSSYSLSVLKRKLTSVMQLVYEITSADVEKVMQWAKLRNAPTHYKHERYRPPKPHDWRQKEYYLLVNRIVTSLLKQKELKTPSLLYPELYLLNETLIGALSKYDGDFCGILFSLVSFFRMVRNPSW